MQEECEKKYYACYLKQTNKQKHDIYANARGSSEHMSNEITANVNSTYKSEIDCIELILFSLGRSGRTFQSVIRWRSKSGVQQTITTKALLWLAKITVLHPGASRRLLQVLSISVTFCHKYTFYLCFFYLWFKIFFSSLKMCQAHMIWRLAKKYGKWK